MTNFGYAEIGYLTRLKRREIKDQVRTRDKFDAKLNAKLGLATNFGYGERGYPTRLKRGETMPGVRAHD